MKTLSAFHGDPAIKANYLLRVKQHRKADELVQGYGYWRDGKGCAVGCTLHKDDDPHQHYEALLGIPERLAYLEDAIFEGLPVELARKWPERFLSAITPGADLSLVWHTFAVWMLRDSGFLVITKENREAINAVINLHVRGAAGDQPSDEEWWSAEREATWAASWTATMAARSATWSATRSAARSARSAAWSTAEAAWSATRSATWSTAEAARSAAYQKMANELIRLLKAAKQEGGA